MPAVPSVTGLNSSPVLLTEGVGHPITPTVDKKTRRQAPGLQSSICKSLVQETKKMQTDDDDERNTCQPENDVTSHYANS